MNTIIYLYHSREITKFMTEKWQEEDYCLIRLGVPCLLWKNLQRAEEDGKATPEGQIILEKQASSGEQASAAVVSREWEDMPEQKKRFCWLRWKIFSGIRRKVRDRSTRQLGKPKLQDNTTQSEAVSQSADAEQEKKQLRSRITELMEELKELQIALCLLGDNPFWTYCVYEDYLREKIDTACWRQYWAIPEFMDYHEDMWVRELMQNTVPGHYMILGYADCLPKILCENAAKMRSIKWFLKEKQYTRDVQLFVEDFYEEYGLAVEVRPVDEKWARVRPASAVPVNVLDFTGEEKLSACDVADGSIWLDMDSMDGKNRRIEARNPNISYFSLKKLWKQRQKETICLDTINKNRYNT